MQRTYELFCVLFFLTLCSLFVLYSYTASTERLVARQSPLPASMDTSIHTASDMDTGVIDSLGNVTESLILVREEKPEQHHAVTYRLVISLKYSEKMTMATTNMYMLSRFAAEWKANITLPFVEGEYLSGIPYPQVLPLDYLYDVNRLNEMNAKYDILQFVDYEFFIRNSTRRVFYFHIYYFDQGGTGPVVEACTNTNEIQGFNDTLATLNKEAQKRKLSKFSLSLSKCCKVRSSQPTLPEDFIKGCEINTTKEFTIVINDWRGYSGDKKKTFRIVAPKYHNLNKRPDYDLPHSKYVINNAVALVKKLAHGEQFIGVHIRAQKMQLRHTANKDYDHIKCVRDMANLVQQLKRNHTDTKHTLYFGDFYVKKYKTLFKELNIHVTHYDPKVFNGVKNAAFIAQVEQNVVSRATILVLCGGGSFESTISHRFRKNNPNGKEYRICSGS